MKTPVVVVALMSIILCGERKKVVDARHHFVPCPPMPTKTPMIPFNIDQFTGKWYGMFVNAPEFASNGTTKCLQIKFKGNSSTVEMAAAVLRLGDTISGKAYSVAPSDGTGKIVYFKPSPTDPTFPAKIDIVVLDTDYQSYAVVYICGHIGPLLCVETSMILSRKPNLTDENQEKIERVLRFNKMDGLEDLIPVEQNCGPYLCDGVDHCFFTRAGY